MDIEVFDLRHTAPRKQPKSLIRRGRTLMRDPATVTGITVHQTACEFGARRADVIASGGDTELAQRMRAAGVACHALAFREGWVVVPRPLESFIYHGNGFNETDLGLEVEGLYSGLEDDPTTRPDEARRTVWNIERWSGPPDELTIATAREALRWLVEEGRDLGMPLKYINAHRQSSATRRSDPGQGLWKPLVLDYAVPVLGLITRPALALPGRGKRPGGRPIPHAWDPSSTAPY